MPAPSRGPKQDPVIRWINGNLQVGEYIIPWQQCTVNLNASYEFEEGEVENECVSFQFTHPNLVPESFPDKDNPEDWTWVLNGELAKAVRQFLISSSS